MSLAEMSIEKENYLIRITVQIVLFLFGIWYIFFTGTTSEGVGVKAFAALLFMVMAMNILRLILEFFRLINSNSRYIRRNLRRS